MSVFNEEGEVAVARQQLPDGCLLVTFTWLPDGTSGNAVKQLREPLEGTLLQFESVYEHAVLGSPGNYNIYLYDEIGGDWLDGLGVNLSAATNYAKALYESHGGDRVARTDMMGCPTFFADVSTGSDDRGTVRLILSPVGVD